METEKEGEKESEEERRMPSFTTHKSIAYRSAVCGFPSLTLTPKPKPKPNPSPTGRQYVASPAGKHAEGGGAEGGGPR